MGKRANGQTGKLISDPQYGSRAGVWRIMRLFKEYGVRCTSWMVGQALVMNPDVGRALVRDGHEVARWVRAACGIVRGPS